MSLPSSAGLSRRSRLLFALAALVLVVVIVIGALVAITSARDVRATDRANADRAAALLAAEQFALRMDDFTAASATAYESRIEAMLTTKGKADFGQVKSVIGQVFTATQPTPKEAAQGVVAPTGKVVYAGIADIDSDSATALVAHDTSVSGTAKALHFRWTVSLQKIGDQWLVDGLPPEVVGSKSQ